MKLPNQNCHTKIIHLDQSEVAELISNGYMYHSIGIIKIPIDKIHELPTRVQQLACTLSMDPDEKTFIIIGISSTG